MRARAGRRGAALAIGVALGAMAQLFAPAAVSRAAARPLAPKPARSTRRQQALADYGKLPIAFEPNVGQAAKGISYVARGNGFGLALSPNGVTMAFRPQADVPSPPTGRPHYVHSNPADAAVLSIAFPGAAANPSLVASGKLPGKVNYLLGPNQKSWHRNVPTYGQVTYPSLYPGVDLEFSGAGGKLEYTYTLAAGVDPSAIRLAFSGQDALSVDSAGNLVATVKGETLTQPPPVAYQTLGTDRRAVDSRYVLLDAKTVGFQLGDYDHTLPLTIDPVLQYSTYLGGSSDDYALGLAVDDSGNAYLTGFTFSTDFPTTTGSYQTTNKGSFDVFVSKLDPTGSTLIYSTYIGGTKDDEAGAIAVEASTGRVFIVGVTDSTAYPTTTGAYQKTFKGGTWDAFLSKLGTTGSTLTYSTYIGGTSDDQAYGITLDTANSKAMIAGLTSSTNYPTTASADQKTNKGSYDAFVTKIDPNPNVALSFSTYLGGTGDDEALGIVRADTSDREFIVGLTSSTAFPTTTGAFQTTNKGGYDAFFTKMNKLGSTLNYSTYLGGTSDDFGVAVAADAAANGYVTGETLSTDFPTTAGVFQTTGHGDDAFVTKINPNSGVALPYSTYLGGSAIDVGRAITVDADTNAYVAGSTLSTDFPTSGNPIQPTLSGGADGFVAEINTTATAQTYSTYLGGALDEEADAVANASSGTVYVGGFSDGADFPTAGAAPFQAALAAGYDSFVAKLAPGTSARMAVTDQGFAPATLAASRAQAVLWTCYSSAGTEHSVTDGSGLGLFDSKTRVSGSLYSFAFQAAGTYSVSDSASGHTGTVSVPMSISPLAGGPTTPFTVTWAAAAPSSDLVEDIQIERPGSSTFVDWMTGVTSLSAPFTPDSGVGTYSFQARLRRLSTGAATGYSSAASVAATTVTVSDSGFSPVSQTSAIGAPVSWTFSSSNTQSHTATDNSGMGLFDSGNQSPGATYSFTFVGAGTYPVVDTLTSHTSTVRVPLLTTPTLGDTAQPFTVTWASAPPPSGYLFDVQIKRPGSSQFSDWQSGVTTVGLTFVPDSGDGIYSFRSRLRQSANRKSSNYSPASSVTAATWSQYAKTADHTSFNSTEKQIGINNVSTLVQGWATEDTGIATNFSPVVVDGLAYGTNGLEIDAVEVTTGFVLWRYTPTPLDPLTGGPTVEDGIVYFTTNLGYVYAVNAKSGGLLWKAGVDTLSTPSISNGVLYAGSSLGTVYAIDAATGTINWSYKTGGYIYDTPAVSDGTVFIGSGDHNLYALDATTGALKWTATFLAAVASTPTVSGGVVYGKDGFGDISALDESTGAVLWTAAVPYGSSSAPAVAKGILYVGAGQFVFDAFKANGCGAPTCSPIWSATTEGTPNSTPLVANGVVYVSADRIYAFKAAGCGGPTCVALWVSPSLGPDSISSPVLLNGNLFVQSGSSLFEFHT